MESFSIDHFIYENISSLKQQIYLYHDHFRVCGSIKELNHTGTVTSLNLLNVFSSKSAAYYDTKIIINFFFKSIITKKTYDVFAMKENV